MADLEERIKLIEQFKATLEAWVKTRDGAQASKLREWLNQNAHRVRSETIEANTHAILTVYPPPAIAGAAPMMRIDTFDHMFDSVYLMSMVPPIVDMLNKTIGVLRNPPPRREEAKSGPRVEIEVQSGYAFVVMPMDKNDHQLIDVLEAIKAGAKECSITAERIDDDERNERVTDRILEAIRKAEFVIVDLTNERPNVFFEAGYAHGLGKIPIYVAREGTHRHFDIQDYPIIMFRNMKELREGLAKRLVALITKRASGEH
jgi:hypothetical protein